jgi:hypothetical protein
VPAGWVDDGRRWQDRSEMRAASEPTPRREASAVALGDADLEGLDEPSDSMLEWSARLSENPPMSVELAALAGRLKAMTLRTSTHQNGQKRAPAGPVRSRRALAVSSP